MTSNNKGKAGSQIDLQCAVEKPEKINETILSLREEWKNGSIKWYSPLGPNYKEFCDNSFWDGRFSNKDDSFWQELKRPSNYNTYWPKGGPHWDGIAILTKNDGSKTLLLIEAKAHKGEINSNSRATSESLEVIKKRLQKIQKDSGLKDDVDWTKRYYQFANRLAFLLFLQDKGTDVSFVYILFANDPYWNEKDKTTIEDWNKVLKKEREYFGITEQFRAEKRICDCIINLEEQAFSNLKEQIQNKLIAVR